MLPLFLWEFSHLFLVVNGPQFAATFDNPSATMIGVFVAIYEGWLRYHTR